MIWLYYFLNLGFTGFLLLPALSGLFFHLPLAKNLVALDLINDPSSFIKIQWKRVLIFLIPYLVFIVLSIYFLGIGAVISSVINFALCIGAEYKKIVGKNMLSTESFLTANQKYFKDQGIVSAVVLEKFSPVDKSGRALEH